MEMTDGNDAVMRIAGRFGADNEILYPSLFLYIHGSGFGGNVPPSPWFAPMIGGHNPVLNIYLYVWTAKVLFFITMEIIKLMRKTNRVMTVASCCSSRYDFFLVSQSVRQGTVTPTHYNVVHDTTLLKPDDVQRLTYKLCHLYYNWPVSHDSRERWNDWEFYLFVLSDISAVVHVNVNINVTDTILWQGHHDRVMQLNWLSNWS